MINKIVSTVSPEIFDRLGDNSYYYNYDIKQEEVTNMNGELETQYSYIQVHIQGQPDYKNCVQAIIRSYLTIDEEFDLINSYNKYKSGNSVDETLLQEYEEYLELLEEIKIKVKSDFTNYNIAR